MIFFLMKKSWIILLVLIINLFFIFLVSAKVRINEVMAETPSSIYGDSNCEWIEIYSDSSENLNNWILNTPGHNLTLNVSINNFLIITGNDTCFKNNWADIDESKIIKWSAISLNDNKDSVFLFNNNSELKSSLNYANSHSDKSWQYCDFSWLERNPTPGQQNNCSTTQNNSQNNQNEQTNEEGIHIDIEFDEKKIINGEEFKIKIKAYNLKSQTYNFKIWIREEDNEEIISDRYGEDNDEKEVWKSGNYYIYNLFKGSGDKTKSVKLRIRENDEDFKGDAEICFKIQGASESEDCESIEILEKEEEVNKNNTKETKTITNSSKLTNSISGEVIKLGSPESKKTITNNQKNINNVIYESKNEKMKKYTIFGFAGLCLSLAILLLFNKLN